MTKHDIRIESVEFDLLILESDNSGALNKLKTIIDKFKSTIVDKFKRLKAERETNLRIYQMTLKQLQQQKYLY